MGRDKQLEAWMGQGIEVALHDPSADNPRYRASIEEFAIKGESDTLDPAILAVFANFLTYIESFRKTNQPLPPRTPGITMRAEHAGQIFGG